MVVDKNKVQYMVSTVIMTYHEMEIPSVSQDAVAPVLNVSLRDMLKKKTAVFPSGDIISLSK
jgi:hypothetical protein